MTPARCSGGRCFTSWSGGTMAPTLLKNLGLMRWMCEGNAFHSGPDGILSSWSYCSGVWMPYGTLSTKYFADSALPSYCTALLLVAFCLAAALAAAFAAARSAAFDGLGFGAPSPAQDPHPGRSPTAALSFSSLARSSSSSSASKSSSCVPSTKAVRTSSRCSLAAAESILRAPSRSSAPSSSAACSSTGSASLSFAFFFFLLPDCAGDVTDCEGSSCCGAPPDAWTLDSCPVAEVSPVHGLASTSQGLSTFFAGRDEEAGVAGVDTTSLGTGP
mmetsp:Transcript_1213/g.2470  ORF Transcript_1213/g.2470 Transcript_1213/m.2470 type:complete len:274 (+) Transcript_1213:172-993(+)